MLGRPAACRAAAGRPRHRRPALAVSRHHSPADIDSSYGSGVFGAWQADDAKLPGYLYTIDEETDPRAQQPELDGKTDAQHQLGNDRAKAFAYNHGYTQFWSQDRSYQWANHYDAGSQHWAGGYGYLRTQNGIISTLYDDRPAGAATRRYFGTGYYGKQTQSGGFTIAENVYAPWGNDPILLHDVTITNNTRATQAVSWFEYWDVNPLGETFANYNLTAPSPGNTLTGIIQGNGPFSVQTLIAQRGFGPASYDAADRVLKVQQLPYLTDDLDTLSIYAAALQAPDGGYETSLPRFFGPQTGLHGRATPLEVVADTVSNTLTGLSPPLLPGNTLFAFRAPLSLAPGQSVTLRYAYGMAHAVDIPGLLAEYRTRAGPVQRHAPGVAGLPAARRLRPRPRVDEPRADVDRLHPALRRELRGSAGPPYPLAERLLPVPGGPQRRLPQLDALRAADDAHGSGDDPGDVPLQHPCTAQHPAGLPGTLQLHRHGHPLRPGPRR